MLYMNYHIEIFKVWKSEEVWKKGNLFNSHYINLSYKLYGFILKYAFKIINLLIGHCTQKYMISVDIQYYY